MKPALLSLLVFLQRGVTPFMLACVSGNLQLAQWYYYHKDANIHQVDAVRILLRGWLLVGAMRSAVFRGPLS